jgi:REP element-mobilizing transposase RayT
MPCANRYFVPGYVWHITHRCHRKAFLLKFARDRRRYLHWVFEAKKRFGLTVLNYVIGHQNVGVKINLVSDQRALQLFHKHRTVPGRP